jgi:hypothetical protein
LDKAAGDDTLPSQQRARFVKEANWLRILARISVNNQTQADSLVTDQTPFGLDLLLCHYGSEPQDQRQRAA